MDFRYLCPAAIFLGLAVATSNVRAALNFDDLPTAVRGSVLPTDYQRFTWQGDWNYMSGGGVSSPNFVYVHTGKTVTLSCNIGEMFDFEGASFATMGAGRSLFWNLNQNFATSLTLEGWRGTTLIGTQFYKNLNGGQFDFLGADLKGIDKLVLRADGTPGGCWLMDNVVQQSYAILAVPEPTTSLLGALLLLPLACAAFSSFRAPRMR
jgi:hypothetical protein